jgi:diaminopimelate decarboxylase
MRRGPTRSHIAGACFHVGSHCTEPQAWSRGHGGRAVGAAIRAYGRARAAPAESRRRFPGRLETVPQVEAIGATLAPLIAGLLPHTSLLVEPGRYIAGSAGCC